MKQKQSDDCDFTYISLFERGARLQARYEEAFEPSRWQGQLHCLAMLSLLAHALNERQAEM